MSFALALSAASPVLASPSRTSHSTSKRLNVGVRAMAEESSDDASAGGNHPEYFEAKMLQNVRQKVQGFSTTMSVNKLGAVDEPEEDRKPIDGDLVKVVFAARTSEGEELQAMEDMEEPISFEVGAADVMGNPLFMAFDKAVQSMCVGEYTVVEASGGEYDPNLLFKVPKDHQEIIRLEEEFADKGGLYQGVTVALANGQPAVVRQTDDTAIVLDANHPFAGSDLQFTVKLVAIEDKPEDEE